MFNNTGNLLRQYYFTSSGTWFKSDDVAFIDVEVIGGGGGTTTSGGSSSFGSHLQATGSTAIALAGNPGTGSGGDFNVSGERGILGVTGSVVPGGSSFYGFFGKGGHISNAFYSAGGGGYSRKKIPASSLASSESVSVGGAGAGGISNPGVVIVREYSK